MLEVGYVGTRGDAPARNARRNSVGERASGHPFAVTDTSGNRTPSRPTHSANAIARTPTPGLNGYSGYQIFANDAYSIYHSLQATVSRRWNNSYFQAAYTFSKNIDATSLGTRRSIRPTTIRATSTLRGAFRTSTVRTGCRSATRMNCRSSSTRRHGANGVRRMGSLSGVTIFQSGMPFSILRFWSAGTAFLGQGSTPLLGASLAPGATIGVD